MATDKDDIDEFEIDVIDHLLDADFGPLPIAADGTFTPAAESYEPDPIPEATLDSFICLRGPCRYYIEQKTHFGASNARGTLDHVPVLLNRRCSVINGYEIVLTDEIMHDCNQWDPIDAVDREERRNKFIQNNPLITISKYVKATTND